MTMRGFAIGLVVVVLAGVCAGAQVLSGTWDTEIQFDPSQSSFALAFDFSTNFTVNYEVGGWTFASTTVFDDAGWADQTFTAGGILGSFSFSSTLDFAPAGDFEGLDVAAGLALGGMTFDLSFDLFDQDVEVVLGGKGSTEFVDIDVDVTFGGDDNDVCDLDWADITIEVSYPFCCGAIKGTIEFDCEGFEYLTFETADITIPNLPWFTLSAELTFELETKSLVLSPSFDFGADLCFEIYASQDVVGGAAPGEILVLGSFYVSGLKLECTISDVTFTGISFWGSEGTKPSALGDYWEMYQVESDVDACCGPFGFDVAVFFDETSTNLGDIEFVTADISYELSENVTVTSGFELDVAAGVTEWTFGVEVSF